MPFELIQPEMFEDYIDLDKLPQHLPNHDVTNIAGFTQGNNAGQVPLLSSGYINNTLLPKLIGKKATSVSNRTVGYGAQQIPPIKNGKLPLDILNINKNFIIK